jgi:hypothetical protein
MWIGSSRRSKYCRKHTRWNRVTRHWYTDFPERRSRRRAYGRLYERQQRGLDPLRWQRGRNGHHRRGELDTDVQSVLDL